MAYAKRRPPVPAREDKRKTLTKKTGVTAKTYLNRDRLHEPLEKPAAKKYFAAAESRAAACRAMRLKRRAAARTGLKMKQDG